MSLPPCRMCQTSLLPCQALMGDSCAGCTSSSTTMEIIGWCQFLKMGTVSLAALGGVQVCLMTADVHVRKILLKGICNNHEFFFNLFKCSIAQTCGHDRDTEENLQRKIEAGEITPQDLREQRLPGPFSFLAWLRYVSRNSSYADIHIMMATSMMWNIRLTLLYAESLKEVRFRHHKRIAQADMVMVLCQDTEHIVSAGKFFVRDCRKHCKNLWV